MKEQNKNVQLHNNKGFTLVEMIVSMAILMIIGAALIGFVGYSMGQYKTTSNEISVQNESQIAWNQLENMLLAANRGIYGQTTTEGYNLYLFSLEEDEANPGTNVLRRTTLSYVKDEHRIYLEDFLFTGGVWTQDGEREIFTNYLTDFSIEIDDENVSAINLSSPGNSVPASILVTMSYEKDGRSFTSANRAAFRNELLISNSTQELNP